MMAEFLAYPVVRTLAGTLAHFIWQGAALGLAAVAILHLTRRPAIRYAVGVSTLTLMLGAAAVTFAVGLSQALPQSNRHAGTSAFSGGPQPDGPSRTALGGSVSGQHTSVDPDREQAALHVRARTSEPAMAASESLRALRSLVDAQSVPGLLVMVWLVGVLMLSVRLTAGWILIRRMRDHGVVPVDAIVERRARAIAERLALGRVVTIVASSLVPVPALVGWWRPVVLLPVASLAGFSEAQIDALIAHELAHVRRHDTLVNVAQAVAETLLFYHPAVWWISRSIRAEREHCCDDVVIEVCGNRLTYATALADLAERSLRRGAALGATDGALFDRIRRILGESVRPSSGGFLYVPVLVLLLVVGALIPMTAAWTPDGPEPPEIRAGRDVRFVVQGNAQVVPSATASQRPMPHVLRIRIEDDETQAPIRGASIYVRCIDGDPMSTRFTYNGDGVTDVRGEVTVDPGEASVCLVPSVSSAGYGPVAGEGIRPTDVGPGEALRVLRLTKLASIKGKVFDHEGQPVRHTPVRLVTRSDRAGQWTVTRRISMTDEGGAFEFSSLRGGAAYRVAATHIEQTEPPSVVTLAPGEARTDIELRGRLLPTFRVSGRTVDDAGAGIDLPVFLDRADSPEAYPVTLASARSQAGGYFSFTQVPRGDYRVRVDSAAPLSFPSRPTPGGPEESLWASVPASVTRSISGLSIVVRLNPRIEGTVRFEGSHTQPTSSRVMLRFLAVDGPGGRLSNAEMVRVGDDGRFGTAGIPPGRYVIRAALSPEGWHLESAVAAGRDMSSVPLTIAPGMPPVADVVVTFTRRQTNVSGRVRTAEGAGDAAATVIAFPADPELWADTSGSGGPVSQIRTNQHGAYALANLPPGDYLIAAIASSDNTALPGVDPTLLPRLAPLATRVHLEYEMPVMQDLRRVMGSGGVAR